MLQQLMTENRFVSLAPDDPDNSDTDPEVTEPHSANKPQDEGSTVSEDTVYYDAQDDIPYFQAGADPPPREEWKVADPINFRDINGVLRLSHQLDAPLCQRNRNPAGHGHYTATVKMGRCWLLPDATFSPRYPTLMIDDGGVRQPAASQVHHKTLFRWIVGNLSWLEQYDTVYISLWITVHYQEQAPQITGNFLRLGSRAGAK